jgi:hypothetical protein
MHREVLLADSVERRYQGDNQCRVANYEESAARSITGIGVPTPRETAVANDVRQADPDQRDQ